MKIEKLTENKIRIIVDSYDLEKNNLNINKISTIGLEKHTFFMDLLEKAKSEVGFESNGCKLLVESFTTNDDFLVFTLTKYSCQEKKRPIAKRKQVLISNNTAVYRFETLNNFIDFCNYIKNSKFDLKQNRISIKSYLYCYNNTYFLLLKDINNSYEIKKYFNSLISEFANYTFYSDVFENKLLEYGNIIIKNNAIEKGIKYLV